MTLPVIVIPQSRSGILNRPGRSLLLKLQRDLKSPIVHPPVIADLFHRMDKVERMGTGIRRCVVRDKPVAWLTFEMPP